MMNTVQKNGGDNELKNGITRSSIQRMHQKSDHTSGTLTDLLNIPQDFFPSIDLRITQLISPFSRIGNMGKRERLAAIDS